MIQKAMNNNNKQQLEKQYSPLKMDGTMTLFISSEPPTINGRSPIDIPTKSAVITPPAPQLVMQMCKQTKRETTNSIIQNKDKQCIRFEHKTFPHVSILKKHTVLSHLWLLWT
jgi:hypothetical protein